MRIYDWLPLRTLTVALLGYMVSACTVSTDPSSSTPGSSRHGMNQQEKIQVFAAVNFDRLKEDMAKGRGEHLTSFAVLLGVPPEQQAEFFTFTQEKFSVLFPSGQVTATEMVAALTRELSSHPQIHRTLAMN